MLNDRQIKKVIDIWADYSNSDKRYKNANTITDGNEINQD